MAFQLPVFLDVSGKRCVVVGGGQVARRKVDSLLECGAAITVVSPDVVPALLALSPDRLTLCRRAYQEDDLDGAFLAIAATKDRTVNAAVVADAQARGVLVCSADAGPGSDFGFGAVVRRNDLTIAVSSGGRSPAFSRLLRDEIERVLSDDLVGLLAVAADVRREQKEAGEVIRASAWHQALGSTTLRDLVQRGDVATARAELRRTVRAE